MLLSIVLLALFGMVVLYGMDAPHREYRASYPGGHGDGGSEPIAWEFTYMYVVSLFAAGWVVGRALAYWRVDRRRLLLIPCDRFDSTGGRSDRGG